jgi:7-keto-8-aminopelargonate synthetase-like enzyme
MGIIFSGTSYLGIAQNRDFQQLIIEGLQKYGNNYGGSRLSNMVAPIFAEAEEALAKFIGAEAALSVSSGSLAGQLVVRFLEKKGLPMYYAPGTHPALWRQNIPSSSNYEQWCEQMLDTIHQSRQAVQIFANSIDPLYAKSFDFNWLKQIDNDIPITLVVDDSHGIGVIGEDGEGIWENLPQLLNLKTIVVASLGKALGLPAGVILGDQSIINQLWNSPFFGGASPCLPAYLHAFLNATTIYKKAFAQLSLNINHFVAKVGFLDHFQYIDHFPVFYTQENELSSHLAKADIHISSFPYPSPNDPNITRVVLNSSHSAKDIQQLINLIGEYFNL